MNCVLWSSVIRFCVSSFIEVTDSYAEEVSDLPDPTQEAVVDECRGGLSMDFCGTREDCVGDRECTYSGMDTEFTSCDGRELCMCLAANGSCFVPFDCDDDEICAETPITGIVANAFRKRLAKTLRASRK